MQKKNRRTEQFVGHTLGVQLLPHPVRFAFAALRNPLPLLHTPCLRPLLSELLGGAEAGAVQGVAQWGGDRRAWWHAVGVPGVGAGLADLICLMPLSDNIEERVYK